MKNIFGPDYPSATFHDSWIKQIQIDYTNKKASLSFEVFVGDPENPGEKEKTKTGILKLTGLAHICIEPALYDKDIPSDGLWVSADDEIEDIKVYYSLEKPGTTWSKVEGELEGDAG